MDHNGCKYPREVTIQATFSCKCAFFFFQSACYELDIAIKSISATVGDKILLPNLCWYSDLSSRSEKGRVEQTLYSLLSFLLAETNTLQKLNVPKKFYGLCKTSIVIEQCVSLA